MHCRPSCSFILAKEREIGNSGMRERCESLKGVAVGSGSLDKPSSVVLGEVNAGGETTMVQTLSVVAIAAIRRVEVRAVVPGISRISAIVESHR